MNYRTGKDFSALAGYALASLVVGLTPAIAQDAEPDSGIAGIGASEIIVTAQKRSQSINDVGMTITALGSDTLEKRRINSLDDLARSVPGLSYAGTDWGTPVFTLRGVGFYDRSLAGYPTTSVYVDEVPLPFPAMAAHANLDLERVEVLKGPQGTLFGQNSTGGAINFIAARPTDRLTAGMDLTVGRFGAGEAKGYISGPLTDTLGVRIAGQYAFGGPWQRSYTRDDEIGRKNVLNGRVLLDWEPTPDLKIALNLNAWRDHSDPVAPQFVAVFPLAQFPGGFSAVDPDLAAYPFAPSDPRAADWSPDFRSMSKKRQYQAALRADLNLTDDIVLTSISSYIDYKQQQRFDLDGTTVEVQHQPEAGRIKSFVQELRVAGGEGTPFRWIVGGNYERSKLVEDSSQTYRETSVANRFGFSSGGQSASNKMTNYAAFANGEYDVASNVTVKVGARRTRAKREANLCTYDTGDGLTAGFVTNLARMLNPGVTVPALQIGDCVTLQADNLPGPFVDTLTEHNTSWRIGVDFKPTRDTLLYANVSKGYKSGSYPLIGSLSYISNLPVVQESLLDYEVGFKTRLLDRKLGINGAAFFYEYRNKQLLTKTRDPILGIVAALANIPKSEVKGAELELTANPVEGLQLSGGMTYLDAKVTDYFGINAGGTEADFAGTPIPFTPKWQFSANLDYEVPVSGSIQPFFGGSLTKRTGTTSIVGSADGAVALAGFRSAGSLSEIYDLPGYTLLDLRAGIESRNNGWRLMVWGKNVTNKYYWQNVVTAYDAVIRYAGAPATYGVTFSYKFDR